jgi:hypothetical protein
MKHTIHVTFARPDHTCRKTVTLNGGPFHGYTIGLVDLSSLISRLMAIQHECRGLSTPAIGHPHQLSYDFLTTESKGQPEAGDEFTLPSLEEMAAHMDGEMARLGIAPRTTADAWGAAA